MFLLAQAEGLPALQRPALGRVCVLELGGWFFMEMGFWSEASR